MATGGTATRTGGTTMATGGTATRGRRQAARQWRTTKGGTTMAIA